MSTVTIEAPEHAPALPDWRRICHIYDIETDTGRSVCGTIIWIPDKAHSTEECNTRGHSVCVVCSEIWARMYPER
jgi:hypothetical protein